MQKGPYGTNIETKKNAKSPSTKNTKRLCKSTCYAVTNLELTSSRNLSLLSLNSYTSIAHTITPWMLSKHNNSTHTQFTSSLLSSQIMPPELDDGIACTEDFFKYTEMSIAPCGKRNFIRLLFGVNEKFLTPHILGPVAKYKLLYVRGQGLGLGLGLGLSVRARARAKC